MKNNFDRIEELFDVAEKISNTDIEEYKDTIIQNIEEKPTSKLSEDEEVVKTMFEAFKETHEYFKHSLEVSKKVLAKIHDNMMVYDEELTPEMITAFASLQKNINDSLKIISQSFKYLSEAKNNLEKKNTDNNDKKSPTMNIDNANIVVAGSSTREALKEIMSKK